MIELYKNYNLVYGRHYDTSFETVVEKKWEIPTTLDYPKVFQNTEFYSMDKKELFGYLQKLEKTPRKVVNELDFALFGIEPIEDFSHKGSRKTFKYILRDEDFDETEVGYISYQWRKERSDSPITYYEITVAPGHPDALDDNNYRWRMDYKNPILQHDWKERT